MGEEVKRRIRALLSRHEGRVPHAYQDSLGYWTIGVGHLIDKRKGGGLPEEFIDLLLDYDIKKHAEQLPEWVWKLDEVRQAVLVDMCFNLGPGFLTEGNARYWPRFAAQVKGGKYVEAAANMRATRWAAQVKQRADRLATMMETGTWLED